MIAATMLETEAADLVKRAVKMANDGHEGMLRFLIDKALPAARPRPVSIPGLVPVRSLADVGKVMDAIVRAVGEGLLAPDEVSQLVGALEVMRRTVESTELEVRIAELSDQLAKLMEGGR